MTLQQMRNLITIAKYGSLSAAAHALFVSQSSLSLMLKEVERELGISVFLRTNKGVEVTAEGRELLALACQVVQHDDLLNSRFASVKEKDSAPRFCASAQHYSLGVSALTALVNEYEQRPFAFYYRETSTEEVISDVKEFRSQIGLLYLSSSNERIIARELKAANLIFTHLFATKPVVVVSENHPLARKGTVRAEDLAAFPRLCFDQGTLGSSYYAEEPLSDLPFTGMVAVRDRNAMIRLIEDTNGYTVATSSPCKEGEGSLVELAIDTDEQMRIGYILHEERALGEEAKRFVEILERSAR